MAGYVYREVPPLAFSDGSSERLWSVGFYNPHSDWQSESTHLTPEKAADRVHWLNGGENCQDRQENNRCMQQLAVAIRNMPHTVRMRP